jgi:hypothetical protein
MANSQKLAFTAFTVTKRGDDKDDWWTPIGAAFPHQNGEGFNIVLQALPMPGPDGQCKIVLRPPKDDDDRRPQRDEQTRQAVRQENDRRHGRR